MSADVIVTKLNWRGEPVYSWTGTVISREPDKILLRAVWTGPGTVEVTPDVRFESGDVFCEYYFATKPYGLWQVLTSGEAALKCWYCNISTPAVIDDDHVSFRDLCLDVVVLPDGTYRVLDRDELDVATAEGLDPALVSQAEEGLRQVLDLVREHRPPFRRPACVGGR
jgi:protein associated with RNAse G/E